jgi:diacylglycerol kinase (ATP)
MNLEPVESIKNTDHQVKKLQVIVNPAAGVDRPFLGMLNSKFGEAGIDWDARITHKAGDAIRLTAEALDAGCDMVMANGGDGTVMEVANALHGTNVPLAILPGGTGNVMAAELGIPYDLPAAIDYLVRGEYNLRSLDMGQVNDKYKFMLRTVIGFEADMVNKTSQELLRIVSGFWLMLLRRSMNSASCNRQSIKSMWMGLNLALKGLAP